MKKALFTLVWLLCTTALWGQTEARTFHAHLFNDEYKVALRINLYDQDITVPGQEVFGQTGGYLSKEGTTYCWLVVSADIEGDKRARLVMCNDYGSEDLEAELTCQNDSIYVLKHVKGSPLKVPNKGKWQKLPAILQFKAKK